MDGEASSKGGHSRAGGRNFSHDGHDGLNGTADDDEEEEEDEESEYDPIGPDFWYPVRIVRGKRVLARFPYTLLG